MQFDDRPIPELGNRKWDELEIVESDGYLLFPDEVRQRKTDGWAAKKVRVRVPRAWDHGKARVETRAILKEKMPGFDFEKDSDLFEEIEQIAILSKALRTFEAPHSQFDTIEALAAEYDQSSLQDVLGRMHAYRLLLDPREPKLTGDAFFKKLFAVVEARHTGPLADIVGVEQFNFILTTASLAASSPKAQSWLRSQETSTPEPSG